ncbi:hypothetical protein DXG03_000523 [Asterophora parasitica]|uniref:Uncharacterized protein n=1 Tax=Asterophora parasitica TaxID=117018 RepID=A0A9P7GAG8_9AGAR|nr:hypothetical protein DXG03_000523 [Asterophora parasitica]
MSVGGLVIIGVLFAAFLYLYISPLLQKLIEPAAQDPNPATTPGEDTEAGFAMDRSEEHSLMAWIRRRSRGRFADTTGNHCGPSPQSKRAGLSNSLAPNSRIATGEKLSRTSLFSRISIVPHLALPAKLPPAHSGRPSTPASAPLSPSRSQRSNLTAPPAVSSPLAQKPLRGTHKRLLVPARRISFLSNSAAANTETGSSRNESTSVSPNNTLTKATSRLNDASRSVSDCTLHPAFLTSPLKAVVVNKLNQSQPKHRVAPPTSALLREI